VVVVARTNRLVIRSWSDDDVAPLAAIGADAEFVRYLGGRVWTVADAMGMIETNRTVERLLGVMLWALEDVRDGSLVGYCGFGTTNANGVRSDLIEIGWGIERTRWNQGLATEAAVAVMPFAAQNFGRQRLIAKCHAANTASERVMQRVGFRRAGLISYLDHPTLIYRAPS